MTKEDQNNNDLLQVIEGLKTGLTDHATDGAWDDDEYCTIRRLVLGHARLSPLAPEFVKPRDDI